MVKCPNNVLTEGENFIDIVYILNYGQYFKNLLKEYIHENTKEFHKEANHL